MPLEDLLERPSHSSEVEYADWRLLGVDKLVVGKVEVQAENRFVVSFELLDVLSGKRMMGYRIPARGNQLRVSAHRISDLIFEALTGKPGIFSTRTVVSGKRPNIAT